MHPVDQRRAKRVTASFIAVLLLTSTIMSAGAVDSYSSYHYVDDSDGNDYQVRAMVRNTSYSDHIYVTRFYLLINVLNVGDSAVCEHYTWSRTSPYPSGGSISSYGSPFTLDYYNTPAWAWENFGQNMYWSSGNPVWSHHLTSGESVCGSAAVYRTAGVAMYRDASGWSDQEIE